MVTLPAPLSCPARFLMRAAHGRAWPASLSYYKRFSASPAVSPLWWSVVFSPWSLPLGHTGLG